MIFRKADSSWIGGKREALVLGAILVVGLALRIILIRGQIEDILFRHPALDEQRYVETARLLESGRLAAREPWWQPPGIVYALMVSFRLLGDDLAAPRYIQAFVSTFSCFLLFVLCRRFFNSAIALIATGVCALHGVLLFQSYELLPATWIVFFNLLCIYLFVFAKDEEGRNGYFGAFGAGLSLGVSAVFSPIVLPFFAVAAVWLKKFRLIALAAAGMLLPILPVTYQNWARSKEFVFVSTNGGINFFIGNNPDYKSTFALRPGRHWIELTSEPQREGMTTASGAASYFFGKGLRFFRRQPGRAAALYLRKLYLFLNGREIPRDSDMYAFRETSGVLKVFAGPKKLPYPNILLIPLGLLGMVVLWPERRRLMLFYGFLGVQALVVSAFFVSSRHRVPALPVFCVFAVAGVAHFWKNFKELGTVYKWSLTVGVIAAVVLLNLSTWETRLSFAGEMQFYRGVAHRAEGNVEAASSAFEKAVRENSGDPRAWFELGNVRESLGDLRVAIAAWRESTKLDSWDSRPARRAAQALMKLGDEQGAANVLLEHIKAGKREPSHYAPDYVNLGFIYARLGDRSQVLRCFHKAVSVDKAYSQQKIPAVTGALLTLSNLRDPHFWRSIAELNKDLGAGRIAVLALKRAYSVESGNAGKGE